MQAPGTIWQTLGYKVWCANQLYLEESAQTKIVAAYQYLQDAIDYAADLARHGVRCVLTGPYKMATEYTRNERDANGYRIQEADCPPPAYLDLPLTP